MIVVTGGAGFIGSAIVWELNKRNIDDILIVDELGLTDKWKNLTGLKFKDYIHKDTFLKELHNYENIEAIIHMGANSSTTEKDADHLYQNNFEYTRQLCIYSIQNNTRFIYASSAATYGDGSLGFVDDESKLYDLRPLNMYGYSKSLFDLWAKKNDLSDKIVGIKFFNVYGPNEYHKGDMRSVVVKAYEQIRDHGYVNLFKSNHPDYKDGEQLRDFVYVKDAVNMTLFFLDKPEINGIYNVGTGEARSWVDLVSAIFRSLNKEIKINFVDMPDYLAPKYQYYTKAEMEKLFSKGFNTKISSLEDGVKDYVQNYLIPGKHLDFN